MNNAFWRVFLSLLPFITMAQSTDARYLPKPYTEVRHPEWVKNATLYELNVRQFTSEGTFKAVEKQLPRLKEMGIDIIWLMPVNPIGEKNRKGSLGSYYSVKDYLAINPEFGTEGDFRHLVSEIHRLDMHVIIDWVANHSSLDNALVKLHPEWYRRDAKGQFQSTPWRDYDDIIEFDYSQPELRRYMTGAMKHWVREFDIDGFRCDVADFVPLDFWENLRTELDEVKPVFMLAEAENRELHRKAFDATYAWKLWEVMHAIAQSRTDINPLTGGYITEHITVFPKEGIRVNFTENHDKNSWEGNQYNNFGASLKAMMVLTTVMDGLPLVYNGQEAGLDRSLAFFEKDPIAWKNHENAQIYAKLFQLKHRNQALWNGGYGGEMVRLVNNRADHVLSFLREKNGDRVIAVLNLSAVPQDVAVETPETGGLYRELFSDKPLKIAHQMHFKLQAWEFRIYHQTKTAQ